MVAELPRPPATTDWQQLLSLYADSVHEVYLNNRLEMILALMPTSHESFHQASQEFGKALYDLLTANGASQSPRRWRERATSSRVCPDWFGVNRSLRQEL